MILKEYEFVKRKKKKKSVIKKKKRRMQAKRHENEFKNATPFDKALYRAVNTILK